MADKKSRLAEIYKSEKATGGGLTSTLGKRFKEKFDPRQMFNQQGFMAALLPSIFKAYKAPSLSSKLSPALSPTASSGVGGLSNEKLDILIAQSKDIKINSTIVAKNSMSNAAMARDMNLMRQNIFQLVKLNKGKPTNKADMFFKHASDRDKEYKSKFKKESKVANNTAPTKTGDTGKSEGLLGLGGALGGALSGLSKGIGIASKLGGLGLGLAAFLTALGGAAWAIDKLGGMSGLKDVLTNLAEGLGAFSGGSLVALGALFAGSMLFGGGTKGLNIAVVGVGIAGFLTALGGAAFAIDAMGGSGGIKTMLTDLAEGLGAFSDGSLIALGSLFAGSALFGMVPGGAKGAVLGIAAVGLGIGAFLTALGGAAALIDAMGGSGGIKTMLTDLAEGLGAFSDGSLVALGSLFAAGAIFGATGLAGPAALGIGAIGVGIGAFLLGLSGAAAIINLFGGGPKLKELLVNLAEGLGAFSNIDAGNLLKIAGTLPLFGASMLAFFGAAGIGGIVQSLAGGMKGLIDFIFGNEKKSPMQKLSEDLQLFQNINGDNLSKIGQGMKDLASGMLGLAKLTDEDLAKVNKAAAIAKSTGGVNAAGATQPPSTSAPGAKYNPAADSQAANTPVTSTAVKNPESELPPSTLSLKSTPKYNPAADSQAANTPAPTSTSTPGAKYNPAADSQAANTPVPTSTSAPQPPTTSPTKSSTTPITTGSGGAAFGMYPKPGGIQSDLMAAFAQEGITDEKTQIALLANIKKESGFKPISENLNYTSTARLKEVFPSKTKNLSDEELKKYTNNPEGLAELVYGGRMGNTEPGDGFKYRGRGFIQLTGKNNYASMGAALNLPLVDNPDLANDPVVAARIAARYIKDANLRKSFNTQEEANRAVTQSIGGRNLNLDSGYGATLLSKVNSYAGDISLASSGTSLPNQSAAASNAPSSATTLAAASNAPSSATTLAAAPNAPSLSNQSAATLIPNAPSLSNQSAATLIPNAPSSATTLAAATTAVSQEKMILASAAPVVNNVTNNNVNNSTSGGGSSTSTASVYDDLFTKLVGRALA